MKVHSGEPGRSSLSAGARTLAKNVFNNYTKGTRKSRSIYLSVPSILVQDN